MCLILQQNNEVSKDKCAVDYEGASSQFETRDSSDEKQLQCLFDSLFFPIEYHKAISES